MHFGGSRAHQQVHFLLAEDEVTRSHQVVGDTMWCEALRQHHATVLAQPAEDHCSRIHMVVLGYLCDDLLTARAGNYHGADMVVDPAHHESMAQQ